MAMRPMTTNRTILSQTDLLVVASLLGVAALLVVVAQILGLHLL